jgi:hypothetical protein
MIHAQQDKFTAFLSAAAIGSTATSTLTIDRRGYDHVSVAALRASNASTVFANVLRVEESDSATTDYTNVTALVGGGVGGFTIPAVSNTSEAAAVVMDIDCRARKRYLRVSMTPGASATLAISARMSRAEEAPVSAAEKNVIGWVVG